MDVITNMVVFPAAASMATWEILELNRHLNGNIIHKLDMFHSCARLPEANEFLRWDSVSFRMFGWIVWTSEFMRESRHKLPMTGWSAIHFHRDLHAHCNDSRGMQWMIIPHYNI